METSDTAAQGRLRLANDELATTPFYIGTTRRKIGGLGLAVQFNLERGVIVGSIAADLLGEQAQPGQPHPLAATVVTIRGDDRQRIVRVGNLDEQGRYEILRLQPQLRYYLHFGGE